MMLNLTKKYQLSITSGASAPSSASGASAPSSTAGVSGVAAGAGSELDATQTFVVGADSDIAGFEDLSGKNVAVKQGTAGADFANSLKDEYGFTVTVFEDSPTMYQDVILGNSVACVEDSQPKLCNSYSKP